MPPSWSVRAGLGVVLGAVLLMASPARAAPWSEAVEEQLQAARSAGAALSAKAEQAIIAGAVILYRHRHTIAGATLGCAAGATLGATAAAAATLNTGGASLGAIGPGAALGCGIGALSGAAMGRQLDAPYELR